MDRTGAGSSGIELNGVPLSGLAVESVRLPDGGVGPGVGPSEAEVHHRPDTLTTSNGGRSGNGVQLNGIRASGLMIEAVTLPDGSVVFR